MKFDSYTRFVKSPLYQACLRAESQGQPLPDLRPHSRSSSPPPDLSKVSEGERGMGTCPHGAGSLPCCSIPGWGQTSSQGMREREGETSGGANVEMLFNSPQKSKLKLGKSLPLGVETAGSGANHSPHRSFRKGERREPSWAGGCCAEQDRGATPP